MLLLFDMLLLINGVFSYLKLCEVLSFLWGSAEYIGLNLKVFSTLLGLYNYTDTFVL